MLRLSRLFGLCVIFIATSACARLEVTKVTDVQIPGLRFSRPVPYLAS